MESDSKKLFNIKNKLNSVKSKLISKNYNQKLTDIKNNINDLKDNSQSFRIIDRTINKAKNGLSLVSKSTKNNILKIKPILNDSSEKIETIVNNNQLKKVLSMFLYISLIIIISLITIDNKIISFKLKKIIRSLLYSLILILLVTDVIHLIFDKNNTVVQIVILLCLGAATYFLMKFIDDIVTYIKKEKFNSPFIISGLQIGTNSHVISQNPNNPKSILLYPSNNEENGIEFSYQLWIIVKSSNFKGDENDSPRHVFHKGDYTGNITQCPSLHLLPYTNAFRINVNTLQDKDNFIDIFNIPIDKWIHITIVLKQTKLEVYINGELKKSKNLYSLPRQNYGDVWVNLNGGFDGYLSKLRYHRYALSPSEIEEFSKEKPNSTECTVSNEKPSYLSKDWWLSNSFSD